MSKEKTIPNQTIELKKIEELEQLREEALETLAKINNDLSASRSLLGTGSITIKQEDHEVSIEIKVSPEEYLELSAFAKFRDRSVEDLALTLMRLDLKCNKYQMEGKTYSEAFPDN